MGFLKTWIWRSNWTSTTSFHCLISFHSKKKFHLGQSVSFKCWSHLTILGLMRDYNRAVPRLIGDTFLYNQSILTIILWFTWMKYGGKPFIQHLFMPQKYTHPNYVLDVGIQWWVQLFTWVLVTGIKSKFIFVFLIITCCFFRVMYKINQLEDLPDLKE